MKFIAPILNFLFTMLFGKVDIDAEIYVNADRILIANLVISTRLGKFAFPILHKQLPEAGTGYQLRGVPGDASLDAGAVIDNDEFDDFADTRPA